MQKFILALTIISALALAGCGTPTPKAEEGKLPSAAPAKKIELQDESKSQKLDAKNPIKLTPPKPNAKMQGNGSKMGRF